MKMLKQWLHYLLLHCATLHLLVQVGGKPLSHLPVGSTPRLEGNQTTKDLDDVELKYEKTFNKSAIKTTKPLRTTKLKTQDVRSSDKEEDVHVPMFVQDSYNTSILETSVLNTTVLQVEARDNTSLINYSLLGPHHDYFHMNPLNGVITLAKMLEYNRINRYKLSAVAKDSMGFSSMVPVLIDVQDVDTMDPRFIFPMYEGSIPENQKGNLSTYPEAIKAIDGDLGINETVYYSISRVHPAEFRDFFSIDSLNGVISINKEMDRENVSLLAVNVKATQQNNDLKSADCVVMIVILDENDNAPQFSQSIYEADFPENSPFGSMVLVLTATDKDEDGLSNGYFQTNDTMFSVDNNGIMYLNNSDLDRELTPRLYVQVWVFDAVSGGLNSSAEVIINVTDVNDNNPEFQNLPLHYIIPEGDYTGPKPFLVARLNVTDLDAGLNGMVTVTSDAETTDKRFKLQKNGNIFFHGALDREAKDKYILTLIASDEGNPPRQSFANAVIFIKDINDNAPTFAKKEYSVDLTLNKVKAGDTVLSVCATDLDTGNNSFISYRFAQPHRGLAINEENGDIFLTSNASAISMETSIVIPVIATDHGVPALSSTVTVIINLSEGQTKFVNSNYSFSLLEGMPEGSDVGTVKVTAGVDVSVMYFLKTYTTVFSITEKGTIITRVILDREEQDSYNVLVMAVDKQDSPNTAAVVVTITVLDVNDNAPIFFPVINPNVTCLENENFQDLAAIVATDLDIGNNSAIIYSLENDFNGTFYINSSSGHLMNIKPLDHEKTDRYDLKVIAQDSGIPPLSSTIIIHVTVQDVDDNDPIFETNSYNITVKENEPPQVILNVSAVDLDTGSNAIIFYSFTEVSDLFYIGKESGSISNLKPLDFEEATKHVLSVIAYSPNSNQSQSTVTVIVQVEDVNEEGPTVEYPVYHTVIWDSEYATGSMILDINAKKGNNAMDEGIHYSISDDNKEKLFSIANGTGHIFLTKDLPQHSVPEYSVLTVTCTDSGTPSQSTSVKVYVVISPHDITTPVFSAKYYNPEPLNNWTDPHTYLIQVKAFFLESTVLYSIEEKENKDYFDMDPLSGIMRTKKALKIEDFPSNVTVKATDSHRSRIYSEAIVNVTVINSNQYAPVFSNSSEKVTVKEEESVPTFIVQVQATDKDPGRNGLLRYSLLNNYSDSFTIDATNGKVFAATSFDFETGPHEFQVFICAEDDGIPQKKQDYLTLIVQVLDINDWAPVFLPHASIYVEENTPVGTVIGQVAATDKDSGDNAFILYSLLDDDDQFDIDGLLGNILVKRPLDHELKEESILTVTASNNKTEPFYQATTHLTVHILDDNDNAPQFTKKNYFAEVDVDSPVGSFVIAVAVTDRDEGSNGVVEYSLLPDLSSTFFLFENQSDGKIITATNLLQPGKVNLTVVARDRGVPPLSSMATVIVNLVYKKKDLPEFSTNEVSTTLREDKPEDEPVFIFSAKNAEGKGVTYRIVAGNEGGQFYLNEKTGELWTTEKFSDDQPSYNVTVEAVTPPDTKGPLPPNMLELQIVVPEFKEGPVFEKESYSTTIINTLPSGFPVIKVTARNQGPMTKPALTYSLVNQSGNEFAINKHTGLIIVANVTEKNGLFRLKAQVTDKNGLSAQTVVQILVESPSSTHDVAEIEINVTVEEVKHRVPEIIRVLEDALQNKVTNISVDSDPKDEQDTEIKFEAAGESYQDIIRKLTDNKSTLQIQLGSIFGKPVVIAIPQPHTFGLSTGSVAGIVTISAILFIFIASSAFYVIRNNVQKHSKKPSSESTDELHSASGDDGPSSNGLKKDNGKTFQKGPKKTRRKSTDVDTFYK
ncbi:protocadherin Fat 4-like isoform X1 [Bufo gargarizans]|uniref:protocadherin Fat 4-like isoform X1 n=2 Tax=Bufo gargarizans TaxID=30331 RepID=UPI001CF55896|nr:protocadherin Fat 4-like isoform X1 [Bufo gargarizans]